MVIVGGRRPGYFIMADDLKLPRDFCEALSKTDLSGHQRRVLDVIILKTIGDHGRPSISISAPAVSKLCDLSQAECTRMMRSLLDRNILRAPIPPRGARKGIYRVNLDIQTWLQRDNPDYEMQLAENTPAIRDGHYKEERERVIEAWFDGFYFFTREPYPFSGKDGSLIKTMMQKHGYRADQLILLMAMFFDLWTEDEFLQRTGGLTIQFFYNKLPNLIAMKATHKIDAIEADQRRERWAKLRRESRKGKRAGS